MKTAILKKLRETDGYVSGQELCDSFQVSRTAVWKAINKLKEEGYTIDSVSNRGYRLMEVPDTLSKEEIESRLTTEWAGRTVYYFDKTDSTNTEAKRFANASRSSDHGSLFVAEMQESGKGRRGREWVAPAGTNIAFTLLLRPEFPPNKASMLTLVMAISVTEALEKLCRTEFQIKWPNDILLNKKKICGILTEMSAEMDYINHVVIGVGINVNNVDFPDEIKMTATSLFAETNQKWSRAEIIAEIMHCFEENYKSFLETMNLEWMLAKYNQHLVNREAGVRVLDPAGEYTGIAQGITNEGELVVEKESGEIVNVYAGEVSVRGIYGYV